MDINEIDDALHNAKISFTDKESSIRVEGDEDMDISINDLKE